MAALEDTETAHSAPADPADREAGEVTVRPGTGDTLQPGAWPLSSHQAAVTAQSQLPVALSVSPAPHSPSLSTVSTLLHLRHRVIVCQILGSPEQHLHGFVVNILHPPLLQHPQVHFPLRHVSLQETLTSTVLIVLRSGSFTHLKDVKICNKGTKI